MKFSLLISAAPLSGQGPNSALMFARAALESGHSIHRVFFLADGVYNANQFNTAPADEENINIAWEQLAQEHQVELISCIGSSVRRGILDKKEADRLRKQGANLSPEFELGGLGQLVEACRYSDRVLSFC